MRFLTTLMFILAIPVFAQPPGGAPKGAQKGGGMRGVQPLEESGFQPIFDGKSLAGWDCDTEYWRVDGGAIVGETTIERQPKQNIFCIWKGGSPADFELKLQYRITGVNDANSGIQYRSVELPDVGKWVLKGYQADIDLKQQYTGQVYEERGRGFLALRGQTSYVPDGKRVGSVGSLGDGAELKGVIKENDWNEIHIIARGNTIVQLINGRVTAVVIDDDTQNRKMSGLIGIQLHRLNNASMKMESRNIRLKKF